MERSTCRDRDIEDLIAENKTNLQESLEITVLLEQINALQNVQLIKIVLRLTMTGIDGDALNISLKLENTFMAMIQMLSAIWRKSSDLEEFQEENSIEDKKTLHAEKDR